MIIEFQNSKHINQHKISANVNTAIFHETENCGVDVVFYLGKYRVLYLISHKGYISGLYCKQKCF
jgi:hypothetical protein